MIVLPRSNRCRYCGCGGTLQTEHVVPVVRGGTDVFENLTQACEPCNRKKRNRLPSEWLGAAMTPAIERLERRAVRAVGTILPIRQRPPRPASEYLSVSLLGCEKEALRQAAGSAERALSDWARLALLDAADAQRAGQR